MILVHPSTEAEYVAKGFQLVLGAPALGIGLFLVSWWWLVRLSLSLSPPPLPSLSIIPPLFSSSPRSLFLAHPPCSPAPPSLSKISL
jgi:hypothetical protein